MENDERGLNRYEAMLRVDLKPFFANQGPVESHV